MKSFLMKISIVLTLLLLLLLCSSCSSSKITVPDHKAPLPEIVNQLDANYSHKTPVVRANLYFDNTQSMFGFVTRGDVSNYVVAVNSLLGLLEGLIDYSVYALRPDSNNILTWQDVGSVGTFNYYIRDFYTFRGVFKSRTDGPLQLLFDQDSTVVNFDEINFFITDLGEQNMRNIVLARRLNEIILNRDDYAILLYCIQSRFQGMAAVPLHGVVSPTGESLTMAVDNNFSGVRPAYLLVTGPTDEILKFNTDIAKSLQSAGLEENDDFFRSVILPRRGIQYTGLDNVVTFHFEEDTPEHRITLGNTNENFNFVNKRYEDLFLDIDKNLPGLNFIFTDAYTPDRIERNHGKVNLVLPLNSLIDGRRAENVTYRIDVDQLVVMGGSLTKVDQDDPESSQTITPLDEETGFIWEELSPYQFEQFLDISLSTLSYNDEIEQVNEITDQLLRSGFENKMLYHVDNENGALHFQLFFTDVKNIGYDFISIYLPVYGKVDRDDQVPGWIGEFNLTTRKPFDRNNPGATPEYFTKTDGLLEFYKLLLGDYTSSVELEQYEGQMEKLVTELLTNFCFVWQE